MRNWRKNNQFEKRAAEARAERGEMILAGRTSDDIPFGIRALAEDPDVEGVWNSRTHTPLHGHTPQPGRPVASLHPASQPKRDPPASSIEQPATAHNGLNSPNGMDFAVIFFVFSDNIKSWSHLQTQLQDLMVPRHLEQDPRSLSSITKDLILDPTLQNLIQV